MTAGNDVRSTACLERVVDNSKNGRARPQRTANVRACAHQHEFFRSKNCTDGAGCIRLALDKLSDLHFDHIKVKRMVPPRGGRDIWFSVPSLGW